MKTIHWKLLNTPRNDESKRPLIRKELIEAFNDWSQYIEVEFVEKSSYDTADDLNNTSNLYIGFFKGNHKCIQSFDGKGSQLAHGTYKTNKSMVIHFDDAENWIFNYQDYINDFFKLLYLSDPIFILSAKHEIGHILGLPHNDSIYSLMYFEYNKFIHYVTENDVKMLAETSYKLRKNTSKPLVVNKLDLYFKVHFISILYTVFIFALLFYFSRK